MRPKGTSALRILLVVLPLLFLLAVLWLHPPLVADVMQPNGLGEASLAIPPDGTVEQSFLAAGDHVDAVGLIIATAGVTDGTVDVGLREASTESVAGSFLASATVQIRSVTNWQNVIFRLPRVATRPGTEYVWSVSSPSGAYLGAAPDGAWPDGIATVGGAPINNDLIFRVYRDMKVKDLARPASGAAVWFAAFLVLVGAVIVGWAIERLLVVK